MSQRRAIRIEGDVAFIPLTKGYEAIIDADDVPIVSGQNWRALVSCGNVYGLNDRHMLHRLIMPAPPGRIVDHIDRNGLNNRRSNLRVCDPSENIANTKIYKNNRTGAKGVSFSQRYQRYRAGIMQGGKTYFLGYFDSLEEAADAYREAAAKRFGKFAHAP